MSLFLFFLMCLDSTNKYLQPLLSNLFTPFIIHLQVFSEATYHFAVIFVLYGPVNIQYWKDFL